MLMPSVLTRAGGLSGGRAEGSTGARGKQSSMGDFDLLLAGVKSNVSFTTAVEKETANSSQKADKNKDLMQGTSDEAARTFAKQPAAADQAQEGAKTNSDKALDKPEIEGLNPDNEEDSKAFMERMAALASTISALLMEKLQLSPEDFNKLLDEMDMTAPDLLEADKLQGFVLAASGEENILALLTNEKLSAIMKELNLQIDSLKAEAGIPQDFDLELLKKLLDMQGPADDVQADEAAGTAQELIEPGLELYDEISDAAIRAEAGDKADGKLGLGADEIAQTQVKGGQNKENAASGRDNTSYEEQNAFQSFVDNMVRTVAQSESSAIEGQGMVADLREIAYQIIDRIKLSVTPDQSSLELSLNPESLGRVKLTIESSPGGMTARFAVENQISKEAIESQLGALREALNQQGIKVEAIEVTVSTYAFDQNSNSSDQNQSDSQKSNSGRRISMEEAFTMTEEPVEDGNAIADRLMSSQINYVA